MQKVWLTMLAIVIAAMPLMAQEAPTGLTASHDGNGTVTLDWYEAFQADYEEDFEDGQAQDWIYDVDGNWSVANGHLAGEITPVDVQWTGAAYSAVTYSDYIAEAEMTREAGTDSFSQGLFLRASGPYGDVTGYSGYMVNIAPASFGGAFLIVKYVNDVATYITPAWVDSEDINVGVGASNVVSVMAFGNTFTVFINGVETFSWEDSGVADGYVGLGFAEDIGVFGRVEYDYIACDDQAAVAASMPAQQSVDMPVVDDEYITRVPARVRTTPMTKTQPDGILYANGIYQGSNTDELDEFIEFRVYRDGNLIASPVESDYVDTLPGFGSYSYTVTAFYDEGESDAAGPEVVNYLDPGMYPVSEDFDDGMPDTWTVEGSAATLSWHVDYGDERGLFPTPYMLVDSDAPGSCPHLMERLITPMVELDNPNQIVLEYDHFFDMYAEEYGYVEWSTDSNNWNTLVTYDVEIAENDVQFDVTDELAGEGSAYFSFYYDDLGNWGWYWGVDNVEVFVDQDGGTEPATLTLTPVSTIVPEAGGDVVFDAALMTTIGQSYPNVQYWAEVTLPNGQVYGPIGTMTFTLPANADLEATGMAQAVPGFAPAGSYTYAGFVGYPTLYISDSFTFTKEGTAANMDVDPTTWAAKTTPFIASEGAVESTLPAEFELSQAFPNPFNPTANVSVSLPNAAELTVGVYNVMGQQVAELASGQFQAGRHNFVIDGSNLSSGVYFIQAHVPGELNSVQKVTLMK